MWNKILKLILCDRADALSITRVVSGTAATAAVMAARDAEVEAVVNGGINSDDNIEADGVTKAAINSDVVRANYGLVQHTDGALYVDVSDTNPSLEISDGGVRAKVYGLINRTTNGLTFGRSGDILFSTITTALNGWTNVSATYADKFIRIGTSGLSAGGADTHTHGAGTFGVASHNHGGYTGGIVAASTGLSFAGILDTEHRHAISAQAAASVTGTSASANNVPVYITLIMFQKD